MTSPKINRPSNLFEDQLVARDLSGDQAEHKRYLYEKMAPRRRKFIDRMGYDLWDPFAAPKEPMDLRTDNTQRTTQQLLREFLHSVAEGEHGSEYARGALDAALGVVNKEDKFRGIFDFCLWYYDLLLKAQKKDERTL